MSKNSSKMCIECNRRATYYKNYGDYICNNCKELDKYNLITKTSSKEIYLLDNDDLTHLKKYEGENRYGPVTYYTKEDLINYTAEKYNFELFNFNERLEELKQIVNKKKEDKRKMLEIKRNEKRDKRKESLIKHLKNAGLELRDDSQLCENYINGDKTFTIKFIVRRMCEMKYLFEYCRANECKNELKNKKRYKYYVPFDDLEYYALEKYSNGKYPKEFPWLVKNNQVINL
jgi:hypothetical protein